MLHAMAVAVVLSFPGAVETVSHKEDLGPGLAFMRERIEGDSAAEAEMALRFALSKEPHDPDILNLLGYANRKLGRFQVSRDFYTRALTIEPGHVGALECMGELELTQGNSDAAREMLGRLQLECPHGCSELDRLLQAFDKAGVEAEPNDI